MHRSFVESKSNNIHQALYDIAAFPYNSGDLSKQQMNLAIQLLQGGANPDYIDPQTGKSTLEAATRNTHGALIKKLIDYNVNVLAQASSQQLPLQIAMGSINYLLYKEGNPKEFLEAREILFRKTMDALNFEPDIENIFKEVYETLAITIQSAVEKATENKKHLLIILGECHVGMASFIIAFMIMLLADKHGINTLFREQDTKVHEFYKNHPCNGFCNHEWNTTFALNEQFENLNMNTIPVDQGRDQNDFEDYSDEGIAYRDKVMHEVITQGYDENGILIVGYKHLEGMLDLFRGSEEIEVLPILSDLEIAERAGVKITDARILKISEDLEKFTSLLTPNAAVHYVRQAHENKRPVHKM